MAPALVNEVCAIEADREGMETRAKVDMVPPRTC